MEAIVKLDTTRLGIPVEIGHIDKELGKLWESSDDTKTRASLINFVIHTDDPASIAFDTEIISTIAAKHACRAILIFSNPHEPASSAQAWINAHCHKTGKGDRQLCSEQITFRLDGESAQALPNIVFSHLDSDLPLCLWWQGDLPEPIDETLWSWVDRLIYDSAEWENPAHQFSIVRHLSARDRKGTVLCDLNWTRLQPWRYALASLFDHAAAFPRLSLVDAVEIDMATGTRTSQLLLLGWLACQLGWTPGSQADEFLAPDDRRIACKIRQNGNEKRKSVVIRCEGAEFELAIGAESDFFEATIQIHGCAKSRQLFPAPRQTMTDTLLAELSRAGRHPLYTKSLETILPLLAF